MISIKDRAPLHPGRVQLNPVTGQPNIFDLMRADSPTEVGTALNRRTMQLLQADIRTYTVATGQTIAAKDVVNIVSNQITKAGTPTQAIALQSGTAGQSIDIIFDGVAELPGITAGTQITSAGVQGYAPQDGWLWVRPEWENIFGAEVVVGGYAGTGTFGASNKNILTLDFKPRAIQIIGVRKSSIGENTDLYELDLYSTSDYGISKYYGSNPIGKSIVKFSFDGNSVSWYSADSAAYQMNHTSYIYSFVALR